jgi:REP element-mobilizing transposase RayT
MAPFDPKIHHRRSIRLKGYDYAQAGAYFVTVVTHGRECLFGEVVDGEMILNEYGTVVQKWWNDISAHFPGVELGEFVVMPNHVHGIIIIHGRGAVPAPYLTTEEQGGGTPPLQKIPTLGQIVGYFKYKSTKEMNLLEAPGVITRFWQRNYYERIIRNEREMDAIWAYIEANPSAWAEDAENVQNVK